MTERTPHGMPDSQAVRDHLQAVLRSPQFARSARLCRFLEYIVDRQLTGRSDDIQEYAIALEVFDRRESFDPRSESIVRVEARRLRDRLAQYYEGPGATAPWRIVLPERGYVPSFERRPARSVPATRVAMTVVVTTLIVASVYAVFRLGAPASHHDPVPRAHEAFEEGLAAWQQWTGESAVQAIAFLEEAVAIDPQYARAHAWLSMAYRQRAIMGDVGFQEIASQSETAARRAIALDPELADGYYALGVHLTFEPAWQAAEDAFRTAIDLAPDDADIHHAFGIVLLAASPERLDEAEAEVRRAVALEPGTLGHRVVLGKILYFRGRIDEARAMLEGALRIDAHYPDAMRNLASVLVQQGDFARAIDLLREAQRLSYLPWGDGLLGHALARSGRPDEARALLVGLEAPDVAASGGALAAATIHVGLSEWAEACDGLSLAWTQREIRTRYVAVDPVYLPLRGQACFGALLDDMELSAIAAPSH